LLTDPSEGQSCGNEYCGIGDSLPSEFSCDSGKGKNIIVLVGKLIRCKFLVTHADGIILAIPIKQVADKGGFGIGSHNASGKAAVGCLHVTVSVVDTNYINILKLLHFAFLLFLLVDSVF
jgi:hypothetical protein